MPVLNAFKLKEITKLQIGGASRNILQVQPGESLMGKMVVDVHKKPITKWTCSIITNNIPEETGVSLVW